MIKMASHLDSSLTVSHDNDLFLVLNEIFALAANNLVVSKFRFHVNDFCYNCVDVGVGSQCLFIVSELNCNSKFCNFFNCFLCLFNNNFTSERNVGFNFNYFNNFLSFGLNNLNFNLNSFLIFNNKVVFLGSRSLFNLDFLDFSNINCLFNLRFNTLDQFFYFRFIVITKRNHFN